MTPSRRSHRLTRDEALAAQADMLWTPEALSRWGAGVAFSLVVLVVAWYQVSGKASWDDQVAPLNLALVGALGVYAAGAALVLSGRRRVGLRRLALLGEPPAEGTAAPVAVLHGDGLVAGDGLTRFHRSDCSLVSGKSFPSATRSEHESAGRTPCGVCRP